MDWRRRAKSGGGGGEVCELVDTSEEDVEVVPIVDELSAGGAASKGLQRHASGYLQV